MSSLISALVYINLIIHLINTQSYGKTTFKYLPRLNSGYASAAKRLLNDNNRVLQLPLCHPVPIC